MKLSTPFNRNLAGKNGSGRALIVRVKDDLDIVVAGVASRVDLQRSCGSVLELATLWY